MTRLPRSKAHSSTVAAFDEVHTMPPLRPQNALIAADEFIYVTGMISARSSSDAPRTPVSCSQASSTWSIVAISAMEHPAARFGRITDWWFWDRISAVSAMKWTPQNTNASASGWSLAAWASMNESPTKSAYLT